MNVCAEGGGGRPADRAGGTGTSGKFFEGGESTGFVMPRPALSSDDAAAVDDVRSGWLVVGVVGEGPGLSDLVRDAEGFRPDGFSESPRAGRSTTRSARGLE